MMRDSDVREEARVSVNRIACALGVHPSTVRAWGRGERKRRYGSLEDNHPYAGYLRIMRGLRNHIEIEESQ
jgi:hypothetical protein